MRVLATMILLFLAILLSPIQMLAGQRDAGVLAGINTIYIEWTPTTDLDPTRESLIRELTKVGFEIVADRLRADVTLTILPQVEVVVDGDGSIPEKSIFTFALVRQNGTVVWKHRVKFVSRRTLADDCDFAAAKMAAKLAKDKEGSVQKGAHKWERCPTRAWSGLAGE